MQSSINRPPCQANYFYDPSFFERIVQSKINEYFQIEINVRIPNEYRDKQNFYEIDASINKNILIEIKSFPIVKKKQVNLIKEKYSNIHKDKLIIIAPYIDYKLRNNFHNIEFLSFIPDIKNIHRYYKDLSHKSINTYIGKYTMKDFKTGRHNFRYRLIRRSANSLFRILNQTDKRISSLIKLSKEINHRIPYNSPPFKIYWSLTQWLDPKQLYFKNQRNYPLKIPLGFDIDGKDIHEFGRCRLSHYGICEECFNSAIKMGKRMIDLLDQNNMINTDSVEIYFSGNKGIHLYIYEYDCIRRRAIYNDYISKLVNLLKEEQIICDYNVTKNIKGLFTFPGSLNASTMFPVQKINFKTKIEDLKKWEGDCGRFYPNIENIIEK